MADIFGLGRAAISFISGRSHLGSFGLGVPFDDEVLIAVRLELVNAQW